MLKFQTLLFSFIQKIQDFPTLTYFGSFAFIGFSVSIIGSDIRNNWKEE